MNTVIYVRQVDKLKVFLKAIDNPNKKPTNPGWTAKQIVGHLIDSTSMSHKQVVHGLSFEITLESFITKTDLKRTEYNDVVVDTARYQSCDFDVLVNLLCSLLYVFLVIFENVDDDHRVITVNGNPCSATMYLKGFFEHVEKHENQIKKIYE